MNRDNDRQTSIILAVLGILPIVWLGLLIAPSVKGGLPEILPSLMNVMSDPFHNWTPIPMYCSNCGALLYGYRNDEGKIKYECKRCGTVAVRVPKGRRHDKIDLYAPEGQIRYY